MGRAFNGSSDIIYRLSNPTSVVDNFTICAWINTSDITNEKSMIHNGKDTGAAGSDGIGIEQESSLWKYLLSGLVRVSSAVTPVANTWTHVTIRRLSGTCRIFINGVDSNTTTATTPGTPSTAFSMGAQVSSATPTFIRFFAGRLADGAIWTRALSQDEITGLSKGFSPLFYLLNLVEHWDLIRDIRSRHAGTPLSSGTTVYDHPRIILPG